MGNLPELMTAVEISTPGGPEVLVASRRPMPVPRAGEVLLKVAYAGVNRPDIIQRKGLYPAPPGASDLPGLEVAGTVAAVGEGVDPSIVGSRYCALVSGGGYAEYCLARLDVCLPVPAGMDMAEAAALPETLFTVWHNVFERGYASPGVHLVLDMVAGGYVARNLQCLREDGRHVTIAVQGGMTAEINMAYVMSRRLTLTGSTLRPRTTEFKALLAQEILATVWPMVCDGALRPEMDKIFPLAEAAAAHAYMESGAHVGKIMLAV